MAVENFFCDYVELIADAGVRRLDEEHIDIASWNIRNPLKISIDAQR